jgi:hypothetical protein
MEIRVAKGPEGSEGTPEMRNHLGGPEIAVEVLRIEFFGACVFFLDS